MNNNIVTSLLSLEEIVRNNLFKIPDYQRGYSWEEDQLNDLLKDIEHIASKEHRHYTGTIVITNGEDGKKEIVDGQQRLTTLIILLKTIFDTNPQKYQSIEHDYILRKDGDFVLETNSDTNHYFKEAILGNKNSLHDDIKSKQNLKYAKSYFTQWLNKNKGRIDEVYNTVINKLGFICFAPQNTSEIGIMFEVINNRGKELSELEKIKNYFIYYATIHGRKNLRNKINENWGQLLKYLNEANVTSNSDENNFLRNCFLVFYSTNKSKSWYVYNEIKERYIPEDEDNLENNLKEIGDFIDFIQGAAQSYAYLHNTKIFEKEYNDDQKEEIAEALLRLKCQPVKASIMPLFLSTMSFLYEKPEEVSYLLKLIEILNFRIYVLPNTRIARADSNQGHLFKWAHELYWDRDWHTQESDDYRTWKNRKIEGDIFTYVTMHLEDFTLELCPEETFIQSLTTDDDEAIDYYSWNGLRFFLASYEEYLNSKRKETWPIEKILVTREEAEKRNKGNDYLSREHIWATKNRADQFEASIREKRRLGNFVLLGLSSNIQLQNDEIENKVDFLMENNAISMQQVKLLKEYLTEAIEVAQSRRERKTKNYFHDIAVSLIDQRENQLIKFALKRWRLPNEKSRKFLKIDTFEAWELRQKENYFLKEKNKAK